MTTESASPARTLLLLRHGHAQRGDVQVDRARPLDKRGREESEAAGRFATRWLPELALVSDTVRTRETFDHFREGLGQDVDVRYLEELYRSTVDGLRRVVATEPPAGVSTVLLVGHDPTISELCAELLESGTSAADAERLTREGMRTGTLAVFTWSGGWDPAAADGIRLEALSWAGDDPT